MTPVAVNAALTNSLPPAPLPALEPLEMLYVTNGSLLTAEGWWQAHRYYQHRQNLHYQSLHQPGIVSGLGVRVVPAPDTVPSELRDRKWIEIQPGIAIDLVGNPLVVEDPMTFRITSEVIPQDANSADHQSASSVSDGSLTVYVVLAYVDPTTKQWQTPPTAVVKEEFRINERTTPPEAHEVELCRIHLTSNIAPLENAADVFNPAPQTLDLRYRYRVQPRAYHSVQVGVCVSSSRTERSSRFQRWGALIQSVPGLYPSLGGNPTIQAISLTSSGPSVDILNLPALTLLVMSYGDAISLTNSELEQLQAYLSQGCTVVVEYEDDDALKYLNSLKTVQLELTTALADLQTLPDDNTSTQSELYNIRQGLREELSACQVTFQQQIEAIGQRLTHWEQVLPELSLTPCELSTAPLTQYPYLFDELPQLPTGPIHLLMDNGIILVIGSLSAAWIPQQFESPLPRSTVRDTQEVGINILHYASSRRHMIQAQITHPD